jgi:hypothetical protein
MIRARGARRDFVRADNIVTSCDRRSSPAPLGHDATQGVVDLGNVLEAWSAPSWPMDRRLPYSASNTRWWGVM